jgi:hypothetical protein
MTKAQIKEQQRATTKKWLEARGGRPPRQRLVLELPSRGYRRMVRPNRARQWDGTEPMRLKTAY